MSLSRRDFIKFSGATATGVASVGTGVDLAPVEAAATSLTHQGSQGRSPASVPTARSAAAS